MATMVKSFALQGIDGYVVDIQTKILEGNPSISVIGMGDQAIKEAAERIASAIDESGYSMPKKKIIINLAPGDRKKRGAHFDLSMAICLLQQSEDIAAKDIEQYGFIGELSLDGSLRECNGVLPMIMAAKNHGIKKVIIPKGNYEEAKLVHNIEILTFDSLRDVILFLEGKKEYNPSNIMISPINKKEGQQLDFADVKGQNDLVQAVVLAAAGGHNMLMIGEPGCGKTMISSRIPTILPNMTEEECLEVTKIYSISGLLRKKNGMITERPFRAPHHNVSLNALIGGGMNALPGEVSLAHNGVLFLDELAEFSKKTLDSLRQPIENKKVSISRVNGTNTYPANFMFVSAMNPCPCGYYPSSRCHCTDYEIIKYRSKISGPIMDRIDIQKEVKPVSFFDIAESSPAPSSEELREKVKQARDIQKERYRNDDGIYCNAQMTTAMIQRYCKLDDKTTKYLKATCEEYGYSARVIHKILRMARTSADLNNEESIRYEDILNVLSYRDLDQSNSQLMVVK